MLKLFREAAVRVPAYRLFLHEHGVDAGSVTAPEQIPLMTKANYHERHPLPERCRDGLLTGGDIVNLSSGSSGTPTVWPRSVLDERAGAARVEQVFRDSFQVGQRRTLAVICFALGNWVGGMWCTSVCRQLSAKGYPVTVAAPGNNLDEILRVIDEIGGHFDQVVLLGYPPFVKNVVDVGLARGVDWPAYRVKILLAGEAFSEQWRDLMGVRTGMADPVTDVAGLYGTADAGVIANETVLSIRIRRFLAGRPEIAAGLFGDSRLPTLVQYDPDTHVFEAVAGGTLAFSMDGTVPLIRYHIEDEGGVIGHAELIEFCRQHGFDPGDGPQLPFVYLFGRSMFTVSFFGANVYPDDVATALERPQVREAVTGRFVLRSVEDADRDRQLSILVELAAGVQATSERRDVIAEVIRAELLRLNQEFAHYVPENYQLPKVELRPANDPEHFPAGVKHRYTQR
ncbi:phenylacetate-CoA ligase [Actinoplanes lutulentus]|uniref:phenylacetate--CoA ligase family protein n=1 Tax=Actinoplanes lutulentus TaxID=1287878 RepID=UPI0011B9369A|nr:phenylacetate--CoA ligase family protein [Actinoplanes lutulentus]MBB2940555.1 phenylacetate-CoA ligase [Actinoplanes lutulentus]